MDFMTELLKLSDDIYTYSPRNEIKLLYAVRSSEGKFTFISPFVSINEVKTLHFLTETAEKRDEEEFKKLIEDFYYSNVKNKIQEENTIVKVTDLIFLKRYTFDELGNVEIQSYNEFISTYFRVFKELVAARENAVCIPNSSDYFERFKTDIRSMFGGIFIDESLLAPDILLGDIVYVTDSDSKVGAYLEVNGFENYQVEFRLLMLDR